MHGNKDFERQHHAVKRLMHLVKKPKGFETKAVAHLVQAIVDLVQAICLLAGIAIDEVPDSNNQKVAKEFGKDNDELNKGDLDLKPDKAIDEYKKAWEHARNTGACDLREGPFGYPNLAWPGPWY